MGHFSQEEADIDFNLPVVETVGVSKPRVHMASEAVCVACEG